MTEIKLPNIPDVSGEVIDNDTELRDLLIAIKITLEKITGATNDEFTALLNENNN
jgi:hypothetical protein